jgi:hypothetical protein
MEKPDKQELMQLLDKLTTMGDTEQVNKLINAVQQVVDLGVDIELKGENAFLNPLVKLRRYSLPAYAKLMTAVDTDREARGLEPVTARRGKSAYLADYMTTKRARERRIVDIWNMQLSEDNKLRGEARKAFCARHAERWLSEKMFRQNQLRTSLGRELTKAEQQVIIKQVDDEIETELDQMEQFMRDEIRKPLSQRNPNGFTFKLGKP